MVVDINDLGKHIAGLPVHLVAVQPCLTQGCRASHVDDDFLVTAQVGDAILYAAWPLLARLNAREALALTFPIRLNVADGFRPC